MHITGFRLRYLSALSEMQNVSGRLSTLFAKLSSLPPSRSLFVLSLRLQTRQAQLSLTGFMQCRAQHVVTVLLPAYEEEA